MWYLKARKVLVDVLNFEELRCARAVFVKRRHGKLIALLTLHVDDGMLFGDVASKEYQQIKDDINKNFKVKHWKIGSDVEPVEYLGEHWYRHKEFIEINMHDYINKLQPINVKNGDDDARVMTPAEVKEFRSVLAKVRWPVARLVPQLAYGVSALAQKDSNEKQVLHMRTLNELINRLKEYDEQGLATLRLRKISIKNIVVLTLMDASFAKKVGCQN